MTDGRPLVFVVEDDADVRETLAETLDENGFRVATAANGALALERLATDADVPHVILLDLMMPAMDGAAFLAARRKHPHAAAIPVILLSARRNVEAEAKALQAEGWLRKPVDLHALVRLLRRTTEEAVDARAPLVLLVDDDDDVREMTAAYLRDCDLRVEVAIDGQQAIEHASTLAPDVVVLDLLMPGLDGRETIRRFKGDPATSAIPVIVLSGLKGKHALQPDLAECAAVLLKPCAPAELVAAIERALDGRTASAD